MQVAAFSFSASCSNRNLAEGRHLNVGLVATLAVPNPLFSVVAPLHRTAGMYKHGHLTGLVAGIWQVTKMMIRKYAPSTGCVFDDQRSDIPPLRSLWLLLDVTFFTM